MIFNKQTGIIKDLLHLSQTSVNIFSVTLIRQGKTPHKLDLDPV